MKVITPFTSLFLCSSPSLLSVTSSSSSKNSFVTVVVVVVALCCLFCVSTAAAFASPSDAVDFVTANKIRRFNKWLANLDKDIKIHLDKKDAIAGNQIFTNVSVIAKGESILKLPLSHVFCDEILTKTPADYEGAVEYSQILKRHVRRSEDRIALSVMTERALRGLSKWEPWIKVLPEIGVGLYLPHLWPEHVRKLITPIKVRDSVNSMATQLRKTFKDELQVPLRLLREHVRISLRKHHSSSSGGVSDKKLDDDFSLQRYLWAHAVVASRAWNLLGKKYLVPGADMFNHDYDVEDKNYDYKRDTLIRPSRSQKFTIFHLIHDSSAVQSQQRTTKESEENLNSNNDHADDGEAKSVNDGEKKKPSSASPYVELLSDRRNAVKNSELFESYGDSPDSVYFQYLGFVASDVEDMILAAVVPPSEAAPPHLDLPLFAQAWSAATNRNRRDCLEMELETPLPVVARKKKSIENKDGEEEGGQPQQGQGREQQDDDNNNDNTRAPPFQDPPKPQVAWARRMLGVGGSSGYDGEAKVCVRFGEVHPLHWLFHYMTQLPPTIAAKNSCIEKTVDPLSVYTPDTRLYPSAKVLLRNLKKCLIKSFGGPIAHANNTIRAVAAMTNDIARRVLPNTFGVEDRREVQHFEDTVIDDAMEAKIIKCRINGVVDRKRCFAGFNHIIESDLAPEENFANGARKALGVGAIGDKELNVPAKAIDVAHLMRLRYSLQQRMILLETQQRLEMKRVSARDTLEKILEILNDEKEKDDSSKNITLSAETKTETNSKKGKKNSNNNNNSKKKKSKDNKKKSSRGSEKEIVNPSEFDDDEDQNIVAGDL